MDDKTNIKPQSESLKALRAAFPVTIPVLTGYIFLGIAFGILLASKGFGPVWAFIMSTFVYAGSAQFVAVGLLAAGFEPFTAGLVVLMVNARHIFYGISMLERFKDYKKAKWYMIFSLTDETFALLLSAKTPQGVNEKKMHFFISLLDQIYWIIGGVIGGVLGSAIPLNTKGIDFVMTALFIVVFLEQWKTKSNRIPATIGLGVSLVCRILFGTQWFILASMAALILIFTFARKPLQERGEA